MLFKRNRVASLAFFCASILLSACGLYGYLIAPADAVLEAGLTDLNLGLLTVGDEHETRLELHNHADLPIRVLGLDEC